MSLRKTKRELIRKFKLGNIRKKRKRTQLNYTGKNSPLNETVITTFAKLPLIVTLLTNFIAVDDRQTGTFLVGHWSILMIGSEISINPISKRMMMEK